MFHQHCQTHQQDTLAPSEEYYCNTGSAIFNHPQEVELWNLSVPTGEESLPTPPDTVSECSSASSDFFDMTAPSWPNGSMPEDWTLYPAGTYRTMPQSCPEDWSSQGAPVTSQGLQALDASSYLNVSHGSVVSGASPVLSHESQSSYTLPSLSEPEPFVLPSAVDLSFTTDPSWPSSGLQAYNVPDVASPLSGHGLFPAYSQSGLNMACSVPTAMAAYPGTHPPMAFYQDGQTFYQRRAVPHPQAQPVRTLLPRKYIGPSPVQPAGLRRSSRPYMQGTRTPGSTVSSVSGNDQQTMRRTSSTSQASGYHADLPYAGGSLQHPAQGPVVSSAQAHPSVIGHYQPVPVCSDGLAYIPGLAGAPFPTTPLDNVITPGALSFVPGYDVLYQPIQATIPEDLHSVHAIGPDVKTEAMSTRGSDAGTPTIRDEASYRTDPLYELGPKEDGLYHCPHENDEPSCGHKPVKLRCNYAKYIDSHLKPFVCKHGSCASQVQKFSSTACLLRHEREAHGMHGHGERPNLCQYEGCDRSQEGNGFPRRYNLLDHMKRVHGFVDELGEFQTKSAAGRKRKDTSSIPDISAPKAKVQRQKAVPVPARSRSTGTAAVPSQHSSFIPETSLPQGHRVLGTFPPAQDAMFAPWDGQMFGHGHPYPPVSHNG